MSLVPPPISDKMCFVHCGGRCTCQRQEISPAAFRSRYGTVSVIYKEPESPPPYAFEIGDYVLKHTGDYNAYGEVRACFRMKNGAARYVVEHESSPNGSFCHIYSEKNLQKAIKST